MKRTMLLGLFALVCTMSHAQLKVDSIGRIGIGLAEGVNPKSLLCIGTNGNAQKNYSTFIYGGVSIDNDSNYYHPATMGLKVLSTFRKSMTAWGIKNIASGYTIYGLHSVAKGTHISCGVFGGVNASPHSHARIGVYGSAAENPYIVEGTYAGFFNGDVRVRGTIYGTLVSPTSVSSPSGGGAMTNLSEQVENRGESVTTKLQRVDLLQMERVNQDGSFAANKVVEHRQNKNATNINDIDKEGLTAEEIEELEAMEKNKYEDPIQTRLSDVSYGLAADQLREVFPELVYEDAEGNYSINYIEMVPLLVQSIRELSAKVTTLEQQLGLSQPAKSVMKTKAAIATEETDDVSLIVPEQAKEATLNIYDMGGKLIQTATITDRGTSALSSYTKTLPTGIYIYSLIVDGKVSVTRKMIMEK